MILVHWAENELVDCLKCYYIRFLIYYVIYYVSASVQQFSLRLKGACKVYFNMATPLNLHWSKRINAVGNFTGYLHHEVIKKQSAQEPTRGFESRTSLPCSPVFRYLVLGSRRNTSVHSWIKPNADLIVMCVTLPMPAVIWVPRVEHDATSNTPM